MASHDSQRQSSAGLRPYGVGDGGGSGVIPPPAPTVFVTETGDTFVTETGDPFVVE